MLLFLEMAFVLVLVVVLLGFVLDTAAVATFLILVGGVVDFEVIDKDGDLCGDVVGDMDLLLVTRFDFDGVRV